jgi:hypothetical protein
LGAAPSENQQESASESGKQGQAQYREKPEIPQRFDVAGNREAALKQETRDRSAILNEASEIFGKASSTGMLEPELKEGVIIGDCVRNAVGGREENKD